MANEVHTRHHPPLLSLPCIVLPGIEEICFVVLGSRGKGIDVLGAHMGKMSHAGPFRGPRSGMRRVLAHPQEHELEI